MYFKDTKGFCQVKKIQKSEKNSDWPDNPIHFLFFFKHVQRKKSIRKHTKMQNSPPPQKKKNPIWGLTNLAI